MLRPYFQLAEAKNLKINLSLGPRTLGRLGGKTSILPAMELYTCLGLGTLLWRSMAGCQINVF